MKLSVSITLALCLIHIARHNTAAAQDYLRESANKSTSLHRRTQRNGNGNGNRNGNGNNSNNGNGNNNNNGNGNGNNNGNGNGDGNDNGNNNGNGNGNGNGNEQQMEQGDLGVRFSKFSFFQIPQETTTLPLGPDDYPIMGDLAQLLQTTSTASSVITISDPEVASERTFGDYIQDMGGSPTYPNEDPNHPFWDDFRAVVDAQVNRLAGNGLSDVMLMPDLWTGYNIDEIAENVHDEYPGYWQSLLLQSFFQQGVAIDYNIFPFRSQVDFVGGLVRMSEINTWAIAIVSPTNFLAKWSYGRPRPEEVAWMIHTGDIPASAVPDDIALTIQSLGLEDALDFTAYNEGSPQHPSWPAMHSAASSASFWMSIVFDLTDEQYCQALLTDYIVSYARTVAGVHYPTDNIVGLNLGQEILSDHLVDHLVTYYDADAGEISAKVRSKRFDWNNFDPLSCQILQ